MRYVDDCFKDMRKDGAVVKHVLASSLEYDITINLQPRKSEQLVITFGPIGSHLDSKGFGNEFLSKYEIDNIYVAQAKSNFYQDLSLSQFVNSVSFLLPFYKVFTYGTSLGGYCAIYYGDAINAQAIAFVPRLSIYRDNKELLSRYKKKGIKPVAYKHKPFEENMSNMTHVAIYDPLISKDCDFVNSVLFQAFPNLVKIPVKYLGHSKAPEVFLLSGVLKSFVLDIVFYNTVSVPEIDLDKHYRYQNRKAAKLIKKGNRDEAFVALRKSIEAKKNVKAYTLISKYVVKFRVPFYLADEDVVFLRKRKKVALKGDQLFLSHLLQEGRMEECIILAETLVGLMFYKEAVFVLSKLDEGYLTDKRVVDIFDKCNPVLEYGV